MHDDSLDRLFQSKWKCINYSNVNFQFYIYVAAVWLVENMYFNLMFYVIEATYFIKLKKISP